MQLRCTYCQNMFALSRENMLVALEHMEEQKLIFYDAHCPKCRRANRVEKARMERFFPDWKTVLKTMEKASIQAEKETKEPAEAAKTSPAKPKSAGKKKK